MEKFTVNKVLKTQDVEGKWGPQVRSAFTTNEMGTTVISAFSKYAIKEGQVLDGTVDKQEKDGKTYHNFKFAPRDGKPQSNAGLEKLVDKIDGVNTNTLRVLALVQDLGRELKNAGVIKDTNSDGSPVPNFDKPEDAGINPEDVPF